MEVRLENTASATTNNDPAHCFVAIELSKSSWVLGFQTPLAKQTSRYQVKACDAKALLELIERVRSRMARELGRPVEVMSCYEAGYDGFWLHRVLEAHGIHNHVLDPASLQVNNTMISTVEAERDAILTEKKSTHLNADKIKMLAKLKAIGAEFSTTLVGEVFYREFANRRQLGSYVGLASSPFCSGSLDRDQGISKAGNPKARVMMIELAWTWLRYQPESALSRWFRERVGNLKGRPRRIAIVAMARKLLVALWRYLQTGTQRLRGVWE